MPFYDEMRDIATELLTEFKQGTIKYISITPGNGPDYDPGPSTPDAPITIPASVARGVSFKYVNGGLAVASDLQVTIDVSVATPDMSGYFTIDDVKYKIVQIINKPSAGTPVARVVIIRKG